MTKALLILFVSTTVFGSIHMPPASTTPLVPEVRVEYQKQADRWVPVLRFLFRDLETARDGTEIGNGYQPEPLNFPRKFDLMSVSTPAHHL